MRKGEGKEGLGTMKWRAHRWGASLTCFPIARLCQVWGGTDNLLLQSTRKAQLSLRVTEQGIGCQTDSVSEYNNGVMQVHCSDQQELLFSNSLQKSKP